MLNYGLSLQKLGLTLDLETGHVLYAPHYQAPQFHFQLVFIRHGETFGNCGQITSNAKIDDHAVRCNIKNKDKRIFQGDVDFEINQLTTLGREQASNLTGLLYNELLKNDWSPDLVFHSPLNRAKETGMPFVKQYQLENKYFSHEDIREMSFGAWDNRRLCDLEPDNICHSFYRQQNALVKCAGINGNGFYHPAENFCDVLLRANNVLHEFATHYAGKKIILFSHSIFGAACCILLGLGQKQENSEHLVFDGKKLDGTSYAMPHATPFFLVE